MIGVGGKRKQCFAGENPTQRKKAACVMKSCVEKQLLRYYRNANTIWLFCEAPLAVMMASDSFLPQSKSLDKGIRVRSRIQ